MYSAGLPGAALLTGTCKTRSQMHTCILRPRSSAVVQILATLQGRGMAATEMDKRCLAGG